MLGMRYPLGIPGEIARRQLTHKAAFRRALGLDRPHREHTLPRVS
jgi:hypothetical protein